MSPRTEADEDSTRGSLQRVLLKKDDGPRLDVLEARAMLHQGRNSFLPLCKGSLSWFLVLVKPARSF